MSLRRWRRSRSPATALEHPADLRAAATRVGAEPVSSVVADAPHAVRVIQLTEAWGGIEHNTVQLAVRLQRRGFPVKITAVGVPVYTRMPAVYASELEHCLEELPWSSPEPPSFADWFRLMRERPAQIAILPKNWWAKGGLGMAIAARLLYPRVVLREHVPAPVVHKPPWRRILGVIPRPPIWYYRHLLYGRLLSSAADRIICVSDAVRTRLVDGCGYSPSRTVTVQNGVDTRLFRYDPAARRRVRAAHGIPENATVFGAVGRLDNRTKRHDSSLRAFQRLCAERPGSDLRFLLVGDGDDRQSLRALAGELGVADRTHFAPFTSEPWSVYSALDVIIMPSAFEGFSLSLIEAMASERYAVAMAVGGVPEIFAEPDVGAAVPPDDFETFYREMRRAVDLGPEARHEVGRRARASILRRFDAERQYERIIAYVLGEP